MSEAKWKKYKRVIDNKMKFYGDIDDEKKVIRIRKTPFKTKKWRKDEVIGTIVHEELHRKHPKMHEKTIYKKERKIVKKMSRRTKAKLYSRYK